MLKGFKDFILKGNVVELATAVIVGAAFTAIVTAFTDGIVQPIINAIPVGSDAAEGLGFQITDNASTFVNIGSVITACINFLIIAAVVYFIIILPYNKLSELGGFGKKAEVTEVALLAEIRDLLDPESTSKAKAEAESDLPDHLSEPSAPVVENYGSPSGGQAPYEAPGGAGTTQRISAPPQQQPPPGPAVAAAGVPAVPVSAPRSGTGRPALSDAAAGARELPAARQLPAAGQLPAARVAVPRRAVPG